MKATFLRGLWIVLLLEIGNINYFIAYFKKYGYLPSPFIWDKSDTFMDFYNPLYWVIKDGFYSTYGSIYPAINFYYLKFFTYFIESSNVVSATQLRNEHSGLSIFLILLSALIIYVVINLGEWRKIDVKPHSFHPKFLIFLVFFLSSPVLFAIERANLIFIALLFLGLFLHSKNTWVKAFLFGILVNIKPYFVILLLMNINLYKFNLRSLAKNLFFTALLFFILGWFAKIEYSKFIFQYLSFTSGSILAWDGYVAMPTNLLSLIFIKQTFIPVNGGSSYQFWISLIRYLVLIGPIALFFVSILRPLTREELIISALILIANFSVGVGGYIYIIYIVLIPYLINSLEYRKLILLIALIFSLPFDWVKLIDVYFPIPYPSYLGDVPLNGIDVWVSLNSVIRPILNFSLMTIFCIRLVRKYGFSFSLKRQ